MAHASIKLSAAVFRKAAALIVLGLIGTAHAATKPATPCADTLNPWSPQLSTGFGFNTRNTRSQASSSIDASNVGSLALAYTQVAEDAKEKRAAPAVTAQTVYFTEGREVVAANRLSGCEYWRYKGLVNKSSIMFGDNVVRSSSLYYLAPTILRAPLVFAGDMQGRLYALNAQTGQEVWQAFMGTDTGRHTITGSAQYAGGTLFVPVATKEVVGTMFDFFTACCFTHGMLQAVDPYTGRIKWTYHTAPEPTLNPKTGTRGPSGMSIWGTPAIDTANNAVLIGTGQNMSQPTTDNSDAVVSLDMATGKVRWVYQTTADDAWNMACQAPAGLNGHCPKAEGGDFDIGAPPIVADLPDGRKAVLAGAKSGVVYSLDPRSGALNWATRLGAGGNLGGIHWGMAADSQRVYAAVTDVWVNKLQRLAINELLGLGGSGIQLMSPVDGARPGIYALDLLTGKLAWEKHYQHEHEGQTYNSLFSAALSLSHDVLFAGSLDGQLKALRSSDGVELWSFNTAVPVVDVNGVAGNGGTIDSSGPVPAGRDLLINSGYNTFGGANPWQAGPGNVLFVFRLP